MAWSTYQAYQELSSSRPAAMVSVMPIPISEIAAYCSIMGMPADERPRFLHLIRRVDIGFLDLVEGRKKQTIPQPKE